MSDEDGMLDDYEEEEDGGKGNDSDFSEDTPFQVCYIMPYCQMRFSHSGKFSRTYFG